MAYRSFEELDVWKRSCSLAVRAYEILKDCRDYGLKDQMTRAAVSKTRLPGFSQKTTRNGSEKSSEKVLALINKNRLISAAEIAVKIDLTSHAVEKTLAKLKANGKIKRVGPDKGGYWVRLEAVRGKREEGRNILDEVLVCF